MSNFTEIEESVCGGTNKRMDGHLRPTLLGVDLKTNARFYRLLQPPTWKRKGPTIPKEVSK